ncbi:Exosome complex exonuclease dis3 [Verticillium dahliae VDG1]|nr:Exosome complex exonuclease dis3 [Verticillium dahliae VDG1]
MPAHEGSSTPLSGIDVGLQVVALKRRFSELEKTMNEIIQKRMASQKSIKDTAALHKLLLLRTQINSSAAQMVEQLGDAATGKPNTARQPHHIPRKPVPSPSPRHALSSGPTDVETQPSLNETSLPTRQPGESGSTFAVAPIDMKTSFVHSSLSLHTPGPNTLGQHAPAAAPTAAAPMAATLTIQPNHIIYRKLEAAYWTRRAKSEGCEGEKLYAEELEMFNEDITSLAAIETQHDFLRHGIKGLKTKEAMAAYWKLCVERAAAIPCHMKRQHRRQQQFKELQDLNHEQEEQAHNMHLGRLPRLVGRYSRYMRDLSFGEGLRMLAHILGDMDRMDGDEERGVEPYIMVSPLVLKSLACARPSRGERLAKSVVEELLRQFEQSGGTEASAVHEQETGVMDPSTQNRERSDVFEGPLRFSPLGTQAGTCFDVGSMEQGPMEQGPDVDLFPDVDSDADSWAYCTVEDW